MRRILFPIIAIFCFSTASSSARLGEDASEIEARYGKALKREDPVKPATKGQVYRKGPFQIIVFFLKGKSASEIFSKGDDSDLTQTDIGAILQESSSQSEWKKARIVEGESKDGDEYWVLADESATAQHAIKEKCLSVSTKEFMDGFKALHLRK